MSNTKGNLFNFLVILLAIHSLIFTPSVSALELVVTDNGSGSTNEVNIEVETETSVTQTNDANIQNSVTEDLNTGGNVASDNTDGDVNIQTGDINSESSISNELNNSYVETEACCATTDVKISGNGADSQNSVNLNQNTNTNINVANNAQITNSINGTANTGGNKANNNTNESVSIDTGNINVQNEIVNDPVNTSFVQASSGFSKLSAAISDNGASSENIIKADFNDDLNILINHSADIGNYIIWDANTGDNEVSGNTGGDVSISTGNIDIVNFIENFVNIGGVDVVCCKNYYDPGDDDDDNVNGGDDSTKPGDGGNGDGGGGSSDSGSSSSSGSILPSAAATEAGGPGIAGLSDTSSDTAKSIFFWLSLGFITFGGKIIIEELLADTSKKLR